LIRINVIVEGSTEESLVRNTLAPTFWAHGTYLSPVILGIPGHKGGNVNYARVKKDILLQLKQDQSIYCSTMLDLYGLGEGFPGNDFPSNVIGAEKAVQIERAISRDIGNQIPDLRPDIRLIPYLQVHEFEGLLFSDPEALANALGQRNLSGKLRSIRNGFATPEDLNDDPNGAPSKRITAEYRSYKKVIEGTQAAMAVGLESMRKECPHFRNWLIRLATLEPNE
jgi:hypothetical protein